MSPFEKEAVTLALRSEREPLEQGRDQERDRFPDCSLKTGEATWRVRGTEGIPTRSSSSAETVSFASEEILRWAVTF
jgi:hypothetical protein